MAPEMSETGSGGNGSPVNLGAIERRAFWLTLALVGGSLLFRSWRVSAGVAVGGVLAILNYLWLKSFVQDLFLKRQGKRSRLKLFLYLSKYLVTGAVILVVIKYSLVNVFGLLAGLLVVIIATTFEGILKTLNMHEEDGNAP